MVLEDHINKLAKNGSIAYVINAWPRLSETFVLNEVVALERYGVRLRIFSTKPPYVEPIQANVAAVRAPVKYLDLWRHWKPALIANLRTFRRRPGPYSRTFAAASRKAIRHWSISLVRHFLKAGYLADMLSREPADHLHAHFATAPGLVAMFTHQLTGIPYSLTAHAKDIYVNRPDMLRAEIVHAQAVVTCTEYNRRYLSTQFSSVCDGKLHCIYHGLDLSQFQFRWPRPSEVRPPVILSVARLVEKKGLSDLIVAADLVRRRGRNFRLEIIGKGPLRPALEAQVKDFGLDSCVTFFGAQPHEKVCLALQRASVFALPCKVATNGDRDGIPNVLLEAMASGVPVVSTPVSGIPELIEAERDGLLVDPDNPRKLADAIDALLTHPKLSERLARAARAKIETRFSVDEGARRLLELFQQKASDNSPGHDLLAAAAKRGASVVTSETV